MITLSKDSTILYKIKHRKWASGIVTARNIPSEETNKEY